MTTILVSEVRKECYFIRTYRQDMRKHQRQEDPYSGMAMRIFKLMAGAFSLPRSLNFKPQTLNSMLNPQTSNPQPWPKVPNPRNASTVAARPIISSLHYHQTWRVASALLLACIFADTCIHHARRRRRQSYAIPRTAANPKHSQALSFNKSLSR